MKPIYTIIALCMLFLLFSTAMMAQQAVATADQVITVPNLIRFAGTVKDANGLPRVGTLEIKFGLYASKEGGDQLWNESQVVTTDEQGGYAVYLGASEKEGIPLALFSTEKARWLGVQVQGEEEQARALFVAVPYALKAADANTVGGNPPSLFVLREDLEKLYKSGASPTVTVGSTSQFGQKRQSVGRGIHILEQKDPEPVSGGLSTVYAWTGTPGNIAKFINTTDLGNSIMTESSGKIGIGTTNPVSKFDVALDSASDYFTLSAYNANLYDKGFLVRSARGSSGAPSATQPGDILLNLYAQGHDGTDYSIASGIRMGVDGTVSTGKVPGAMTFLTSDSSGGYTERMIINSAGNVGIGTTTPTSRLTVAGDIEAETTYRIAGNAVLSARGTGNTFAGIGAGSSIHELGIDNSFFGYWAGISTMIGTGNSSFGSYAGAQNSLGNANSFFGRYAGFKTTVGNSNSIFGESSGYSNTAGSFNAYFGKEAGYNSTTGTYNTFIGKGAGITNTVESNNTFLGSSADGAAGVNNSVAVGYRAQVTQSNSLVLGGINGVNESTVDINVGIGTTAPQTRLQVNNGDIYVGSPGQGIILKSPDATKCIKLTVDDFGSLNTTLLPCP